jgi:hypothetical protein
MRISFDVDETLVCRRTAAPTEAARLPLLIHQWLGEPLRRGTRSLVHELRQRGCSIWIYTSSGRTAFHIRLWLLLYGIRVDGVVNEERHRRELSGRRFSRLPSKYPPAFGIDLHVDDSEGVRMEGDEHGFRVVVVRPDDEDWTQRVLDAVSQTHAAS